MTANSTRQKQESTCSDVEPLSSTLSWDGTLCWDCRQFWDDELLPRYSSTDQVHVEHRPWHHDAAQIEVCAEHDCRMCSLVLITNQSKSVRWPDLDMKHIGYELFPMDSDCQTLRLLADVAVVPSGSVYDLQIQPGRHADEISSTNTGSQQTVAKIETWLKACEGHDFCQNWHSLLGTVGRLPMRMLRLHQNGDIGPRVRLIRTQSMDPSARYATLSHCWGDKLPIMLETSNEAAFEKGIDYDELPQTFRETIDICLKLGIDLLWVDALCILQDDRDNWSVESAWMLETYGNAVLNISADHASDSTKGLYHNRDTALIKAFEVSSAEQYFTCYVDYSLQDLFLASTKERGWVVPERFLSPRVIHFSRTQVYWECACRSAIESLKAGSDVKFAGVSGMKTLSNTTRAAYHDPGDVKDTIRALYNNVAQIFSHGAFTIRNDRCVAFSGIAEAFCKHLRLEPTDYLCGLWRFSFFADLLWATAEGRNHVVGKYVKNKKLSGRNSNVIAPTWSWLSTIEHTYLYFVPPSNTITQMEVPAARLLTTNLSFVNDNPFGQFVAGTIQVQAPLCHITLELMGSEPDEKANMRWLLHFHEAQLDAKDEEMQFSLDESWAVLAGDQTCIDAVVMLTAAVLNRDKSDAESALIEEESAHYIPGSTTFGGGGSHDTDDNNNEVVRYAGLLLVKDESAPATLKRIGVFHCESPMNILNDSESKTSMSFLDRQFRCDDIPRSYYEAVDDNMVYTFNMI